MKKLAAVLLCTTVFGGVAGAALAKDLVIGVSWNNFQEERWKTDEAAMKAVIEANGDKYISADAQSSLVPTDSAGKSDFCRGGCHGSGATDRSQVSGTVTLSDPVESETPTSSGSWAATA